MNLFINATTTEGDPSDEIEKGILRMADSKKFGVLPIKSVTILGMPFTSSFYSDIMNMECKVSSRLSHKSPRAGYLNRFSLLFTKTAFQAIFNLTKPFI